MALLFSLWLAFAALISLSNASNFQVEQGLLTASAQNCGNVPFNLTWSPDEIDPYGSVTIKADYIFPHYFDGGYINATANFHGDKEPFIGFADKFDCDVVPSYIPCPAEKGVELRISKIISKLHALAAYPGDYDGIVIVRNKKDEFMICVKLHIVIKER